MCQYLTAQWVCACESVSGISQGSQDWVSERSGSLWQSAHSLHLSNYANRVGSALTHNLWRHEINTCSPTINKCLFKWQHLLMLTPTAFSPGFHNALTFIHAIGAGKHILHNDHAAQATGPFPSEIKSCIKGYRCLIPEAD